MATSREYVIQSFKSVNSPIVENDIVTKLESRIDAHLFSTEWIKDNVSLYQDIKYWVVPITEDEIPIGVQLELVFRYSNAGWKHVRINHSVPDDKNIRTWNITLWGS